MFVLRKYKSANCITYISRLFRSTKCNRILKTHQISGHRSGICEQKISSPLASQKGGTRDMNMARISPLENSLLPKAFTLTTTTKKLIHIMYSHQRRKKEIAGTFFALWTFASYYQNNTPTLPFFWWTTCYNLFVRTTFWKKSSKISRAHVIHVHVQVISSIASSVPSL